MDQQPYPRLPQHKPASAALKAALLDRGLRQIKSIHCLLGILHAELCSRAEADAE